MTKDVYYNEMQCPDYPYKDADGLQPEINALYGRANQINKKADEEKKKDKMRSVHMYTPFK